MKCVVLQPSYIPWRGYFDQINKADIFVFYDSVQYDRGGWRNRNRIKTNHGTQWLTIPVLKKGSVKNQITIDQIRINWNLKWNVKHWATLQQSYGKSPYFDTYGPLLEMFYQQQPEYLADFTINLTIALARELGIEHTRFVRSSDLDTTDNERVDRLISILQELGATHYISGPSASNYLDESMFDAAGISLEYMKYDYPEYEQLYPPYDPQVSILDLLFMAGPHSSQYIWQ